MIELRHGSVALRPIKESDIADYIRWTTDKTGWDDWEIAWNGNDPDDAGYIDAQIRQLEREGDNPPDFYTALEIDTADGRHIGSIGVYYDKDNDKYEIGISIPEMDIWGKGHGADAMMCYIKYLFDNTNADAVITRTNSGNIPMMRLAAKLGFVEDERHIGHITRDGKAYDAVGYSLSRAAFNANF